MLLSDFLLMFILVVVLIVIINYYISANFYYNSFSSMEVECGFESINSYFNTLSLSFIKFLLLFLVFEVELVVIIPMVSWCMWFGSGYVMMWVGLMLSLSLYLEWMNSFMSWA